MGAPFAFALVRSGLASEVVLEVMGRACGYLAVAALLDLAGLMGR